MVDLDENDPVQGAIQIAIYLIAFAVGPIFLAPLSERFGRRPVLTGGNICFAAFCLGGGFCQTVRQALCPAGFSLWLMLTPH